MSELTKDQLDNWQMAIANYGQVLDLSQQQLLQLISAARRGLELEKVLDGKFVVAEQPQLLDEICKLNETNSTLEEMLEQQRLDIVGNNSVISQLLRDKAGLEAQVVRLRKTIETAASFTAWDSEARKNYMFSESLAYQQASRLTPTTALAELLGPVKDLIHVMDCECWDYGKWPTCHVRPCCFRCKALTTLTQLIERTEANPETRTRPDCSTGPAEGKTKPGSESSSSS